MRRLLLFALSAAMLAPGCAGEEGRRRPRASHLGGGVAREDAPPAARSEAVAPQGDGSELASRRGAPSRTLATPPATSRRFEVRSIPAPEPATEPRPPRRGRVNVALDGAPFEDVARMLSDVGRFGLVVEAPGAGVVDATLRDVDAWDALLAIAHAKGLVVTYERGIAVVRGR